MMKPESVKKTNSLDSKQNSSAQSYQIKGNPNASKKSTSSSADLPRKRRSRRVVRTDTISGIYYRIARKRIHRRSIWNTIYFLILFIFLSVGIAFYTLNRTKTNRILNSVSNGLELLRMDQLPAAESSFDHALALYQDYHLTYSDFWWKSDSLVFQAMLKTAQGYRSLGKYKKSLETFRLVAHHNTRGPQSWVGLMVKDGLDEFLQVDHWDQSTMQAIYEELLKTPPTSWGKNDHFVVQATEKAGLILQPMKKRFEDADFVIYGIPQSLQLEDSCFMVDGLRFYFIDHLPGKVQVFFPETMQKSYKMRLKWYCEAHKKCLIFGKKKDLKFVLNGIQGILICETDTVEQFNQSFPK